MTVWIALFRGINVGGHHVINMKALTGVFQRIGCTDISTYIQSGNVVFRSGEKEASRLQATLRAAVSKEFGFEPGIVVMNGEALEQAIRENPFPRAVDDPARLHLWFLSESATNPDVDAISSLKAESERYALRDDVFYLHAPDGIGRSKLAAKVEKLLGVPATARNWRTVGKLLAMTRTFPAA